MTTLLSDGVPIEHDVNHPVVCETLNRVRIVENGPL